VCFHPAGAKKSQVPTKTHLHQKARIGEGKKPSYELRKGKARRIAVAWLQEKKWLTFDDALRGLHHQAFFCKMGALKLQISRISSCADDIAALLLIKVANALGVCR
jgi:hypothetical protein